MDIEGNVGKYVGASALGTMKMWENCTDIFFTDALYAKQFSVDSEGKLVSKIIKLEGENEGKVQDDFSVQK